MFNNLETINDDINLIVLDKVKWCESKLHAKYNEKNEIRTYPRKYTQYIMQWTDKSFTLQSAWNKSSRNL